MNRPSAGDEQPAHAQRGEERRPGEIQDLARRYRQRSGNPGGAVSMLPLEDEEEWLRRNGLRSADSPSIVYDGQSSSVSNRREAQERFEQEQQYAEEVFAKHLDTASEDFEARIKQENLNEWRDHSLLLILAGNNACNAATLSVSLPSLAAHSDTIYTFARSRPYFNSPDCEGDEDIQQLEFSLQEFEPSSVRHVVQVLEQLPSGASDDNETLKAVLETRIPPDHWVEACRIFHFLQCVDITTEMAGLLQQSVGPDNCMSLVQLADQLQLFGLFEASLQCWITHVDQLQTDENLWKDFSEELQTCIQNMLQLLKSSVHHNGMSSTWWNGSHGHQTKNLFFATLDEYFAIFSEQVEYYQERLEQAKRAQAAHAPRNNHWSADGTTSSHRAWEYAQERIRKQEERVRTLRIAVREQKRLFGRLPSS